MAEDFPKTRAYARAVPEMIGTVGEYVSDATPRTGPFGLPTSTDVVAALARMGFDYKTLLGGMGEAIAEDPVRSAVEMSPAGIPLGLMDANNLITQALQAEEAGDLDKASNLRQLATLSMATSIPGVPSLKKIAGITRTPDGLAESMSRLEQTLKNKPKDKPTDAPSRPDLDEGKRYDSSLPESDHAQGRRTREADLRRQQPVLDLSPEARTARATEQGYNMDDPLYHYTDANFTEFELPNPPKDSVYGPGIYTSRSPDRYKPNAAYTANPDNIKQIPLVARGKLARPGDVSAAEAQIKLQIEEGTRPPMRDPGKSGNWRNEYWVDIHQVLKDQGFTGLQMGEITLIFEPKNLRNINAEFNPAKAGSADLLSGIGSLEAAEGIA